MHALRSLTANYAICRVPSHARLTSYTAHKTADFVRFVPRNQPCRLLSSISIGLNHTLKMGGDHYLFLQRATNQQKIERTVQQALEQSLLRLGQTEVGTTTKETWEQLKEVLEKRSIYLPPFKNEISEKEAQGLFRLFPRKLLRGSSLDEDSKFNITDFVTNPTEWCWFRQGPSFPFTRQESVVFDPSRIAYISKQTTALPTLSGPIEQEMQNWIYHSSSEDALGALLLATPHLDSDTFVHEIGSWNGENLFNLLYHSYLHKRVIAGCLGTDINLAALNMAETTASIMGLAEPLVQFHLANALTPVNLSLLGVLYKKEVKIALRVLPVLDPQSGRSFLQAVKQSLQKERSQFILSYALPKGERYEENKHLATLTDQDPAVREEKFNGGIIFKAPSPLPLPTHIKAEYPYKYNFVVNTYYTQDGFNALAAECGFKIIQSVLVGKNSDNDRAVVLLTPL